MIKVLQVHGGMQCGGTEAVIMNWYRNIDKDKIQFDFTTMQEHECAYDNEIKSLGGNIIYVSPRSKVGNLNHFKEIYKTIKNNGPYDAVHSHMNFHGGLVALAARLAGVKTIICHAHNTEDVTEQTIKRKLELFILRKLMKFCSTDLLACGKEAGNFVFGNKTKFDLINNAVDMEKFKPIDSLRFELIRDIKDKYNLNDTLILGHVGRFNDQKNHEFIVDIIEELHKKDAKFKFLFIGEGELKEHIFNKIKSKNLDENVIDLGLQDNVNIWLNVMDILVFPSLYEGLPVVLVEAQSSGLPCIISNTISPDVDLGLGLIKFLNIDNAEKIWADEILNNKISKITNKELIKEKIKIRGYYLEDNIKKISNIYLNESR